MCKIIYLPMAQTIRARVEDDDIVSADFEADEFTQVRTAIATRLAAGCAAEFR